VEVGKIAEAIFGRKNEEGRFKSRWSEGEGAQRLRAENGRQRDG
jgi:hypothetical protein